MSHPPAWGPTGVFLPVRHRRQLSDDDWQHVEDVYKSFMAVEAPAELRTALDSALDVYQVADQVRSMRPFPSRLRAGAPAMPKDTRANLRRAREAAERLLRRIAELDGNALQLINECNHCPRRLHGNVRDVLAAFNDVEERAAQMLPESRKGMKDDPSREMCFFVIMALWHFCGREAVTAKTDGLLHQVSMVLFETLGQPKEDRRVTIRRAVEYARERERDGSLGPLAPWAKPDQAVIVPDPAASSETFDLPKDVVVLRVPPREAP